MKLGKTFDELVTQVKRESTQKRDFYAPTSEMLVMSDASGSRLATPVGTMLLRERAHQQLAELCGIDRRYYQKLRQEAPALLDRNLNHWLATGPPKQRIVRAFATNCTSATNNPANAQFPAQLPAARDATATAPLEARAILSSRFALLDHDRLLNTIEPVIAEQNLTVESCDMDDEEFTIKLVSPRLQGDVKVGDTVQAGLVIRNSEVGCHAVEVHTFVKRLVCLNGMALMGPKQRGAFRRHSGRDWDGIQKIGKQKTGVLAMGPIPPNDAREQWERQIWQELQQALRDSLQATAFNDLLARLQLTTRLQTRLSPDVVAERIGSTYDLRSEEQSAMLWHLNRDDDAARHGYTLWHVLNAVTRTAQDVENYGRATELETLGGHLAGMTPRQWHHLVSIH
jgi:hypothetical protein